MSSLYDQLDIHHNATLEEIEKAYKIAAYQYTKANNEKALLRCNNALEILKDPYKRSFYDLFGNDHIELLLRPNDGYIFSRLFTKANMAAMLLVIIMLVCNFVFLIYLFKATQYNILRFCLIIASPIPFLLIMLNIKSSLFMFRDELFPLFYCMYCLLFLSASVANIAMLYDHFLNFQIAVLNNILLSLSLGVFLHIKGFEKSFTTYLLIYSSVTFLFMMKKFEQKEFLFPALLFVMSAVMMNPYIGVSALYFLLHAAMFFVSKKGNIPWYCHLGIMCYFSMFVAIGRLCYKEFRSCKPEHNLLKLRRLPTSI
jgi:hypothetical protein